MLGDLAVVAELGRIGAEPHRPAQIGVRAALLQPFGLIHSVIRPTTGSLVSPNSVVEAPSIPAVFRRPSMHGHLHARQMPKKRYLALAARNAPLAIFPSLPRSRTAGDEDAVQRLQLQPRGRRLSCLEHLGIRAQRMLT
jgi:hypothetical protein